MPSRRFAAFDYVADPAGNLWVVRGNVQASDLVVVRPAYRRRDGRLRKVGPARGRVGCPRDVWTADRECRVRPASGLRLVAPADLRPVANRERFPSGVAAVVASLLRRGASLYLYGSRLLGLSGRGSDWDFVLRCNGDPRQLLQTAVHEVRGAAFLDWRQCQALADRYAYPRDVIAPDDLLRVLRSCLLFITVRGHAVDFFYVGDRKRRADSFPGMASRRAPRELSGRLGGCAGESFLMPRRLLVFPLPRRDPVVVRHSYWLLGGLGRMAGNRVRFTGLRETLDGALWLEPDACSIQIGGG